MPKIYDIYLKTVPIFVIVLTTIGYLHLHSCYFLFGINIINYIDISEILLLYINTSVLIIFVALIVSVKVFMIIKEGKDEQETFDKKLSEISDSKERQKLINEEELRGAKYFERLLFRKNIAAVLIILFSLIIGLSTKDYLMMSPLVALGLILLLFFKKFTNLISKVRNVMKTEIFILVFSIIYLVILSFIPVFFQTQKAYKIKNGDKVVQKTQFSYLNESIETNEILKYVGETRNYIFLYDQSKNESLIYEKSKITKRKIHPKFKYIF